MRQDDNNRYYGKYRGTVVNNVDPKNEGRLIVNVPDVLGIPPSSWAMPCLPFTGKQMGMWAIPQIGAGVWVEFEQGNIDYPIWTGCYFNQTGEVPGLALLAPPAAPNFVVQSQGQNTLMISDIPGPTGGIILKSRSGASITINETGITLSAGIGLAEIKMIGKTVMINQDALIVT